MRTRRRAPPPSNEQVSAFLRRAARVGILRSNRAFPNGTSRVEFSYADGVALPYGVKEATILRLISKGILLPIKGETLFNDETAPQRYRTLTADDAQAGTKWSAAEILEWNKKISEREGVEYLRRIYDTTGDFSDDA
jgi:hypothetical protein